jgi:hypothetical protein
MDVISDIFFGQANFLATIQGNRNDVVVLYGSNQERLAPKGSLVIVVLMK